MTKVTCKYCQNQVGLSEAGKHLRAKHPEIHAAIREDMSEKIRQCREVAESSGLSS